MSELGKRVSESLRQAIAYEEGTGTARVERRTPKSVEPVKEYSAEDVKAIRRKLDMSQVLFAGLMGVSPKTVEAWEAGKYTPNGSARRMLELFQQNPSLPEQYHMIRE